MVREREKERETIHFFFSVESLKKQYALLQTKRMLSDYGLEDFNFSNLLLAKVSIVVACFVMVMVACVVVIDTAMCSSYD